MHPIFKLIGSSCNAGIFVFVLYGYVRYIKAELFRNQTCFTPGNMSVTPTCISLFETQVLTVKTCLLSIPLHTLRPFLKMTSVREWHCWAHFITFPKSWKKTWYRQQLVFYTKSVKFTISSFSDWVFHSGSSLSRVSVITVTYYVDGFILSANINL